MSGLLGRARAAPLQTCGTTRRTYGSRPQGVAAPGVERAGAVFACQRGAGEQQRRERGGGRAALVVSGSGGAHELILNLRLKPVLFHPSPIGPEEDLVPVPYHSHCPCWFCGFLLRPLVSRMSCGEIEVPEHVSRPGGFTASASSASCRASPWQRRRCRARRPPRRSETPSHPSRSRRRSIRSVSRSVNGCSAMSGCRVVTRAPAPPAIRSTEAAWTGALARTWPARTLRPATPPPSST